MEWYYAVNKQQIGPVNAEQFAELVRQGIITPETPVWRQGMSVWLPYGQVVSGNGAAPLSGVPALPGGILLTPEQWERSLDGQDYEVKIVDCFSEGLELVKRNALLLVGTTALIYVSWYLINWIPLIGGLITAIIGAAAFGGLMCLYLRLVRKQEGRLEDAFCGFGPRFLPLVLASIIHGLIGILCMLPAIAAMLFIIFALGLASTDQLTRLAQLPLLERGKELQEIVSHLSLTAILVGAIGFLISFVLSVIASTLLQFTYVLILDKGLDFIAAFRLSAKRVSKHFGTVFWLLFLGGAVASLGLVFCLVGVFFTLSWFLATVAIAYERIFPGRTSEQN